MRSARGRRQRVGAERRQHGVALVEFAFVALLLFSLVFGIAQRIVANRLSPALQRIDAILTGPLAHVLGINVGGADLTARARNCDGVALVG